MELIRFEGHNVVYAENQPEYMPLPALAIANDEREIICCWRLTWRERLQVLVTGRVWHHVLTFGRSLQPQLLAVKEPEAVIAARELGLKP